MEKIQEIYEKIWKNISTCNHELLNSFSILTEEEQVCYLLNYEKKMFLEIKKLLAKEITLEEILKKRREKIFFSTVMADSFHFPLFFVKKILPTSIIGYFLDSNQVYSFSHLEFYEQFLPFSYFIHTAQEVSLYNSFLNAYAVFSNPLYTLCFFQKSQNYYMISSKLHQFEPKKIPENIDKNNLERALQDQFLQRKLSSFI